MCLEIKCKKGKRKGLMVRKAVATRQATGMKDVLWISKGMPR